MNLSPKSVFGTGSGLGLVWGASPSPIVSSGGYKYQPGTIISQIAPTPGVPTFGTSYSPPTVPSIGGLWGASPPTASGNPFTPNLPANPGGSGGVSGVSASPGFWQKFTGALFG
jgi:hypothetical protein